MRKTLTALGLTALFLTATAGEASAQRRLFGTARDQTVGRVFYNNALVGGNGFNTGFRRFDNGLTMVRDQTVGRVFYGNGYQGQTGGFLNNGFNGTMMSPNGMSQYGNAPMMYNGMPTMNANPAMYNGMPTNAMPQTMSAPGTMPYAMPAANGSDIIRTGYQPTETTGTTAKVKVVLPNADARVLIGGSSTTSTGAERTFESPALEAGRTYVYTIKATWIVDGRSMEKTREIDVRSGGSYTVNFTEGMTK